MKIHYLGHSELIIELQNSSGEAVRILSDTWLSNFSVADLMQRNPQIEIDYAKFPQIDAIFISHSHMDHLDPYTLVEFSKNLKNKPLILLPESLSYLQDILQEYTGFPVQILKNKQDFSLNWVTIQWIIFKDYQTTNEADVMTLSVRNEEEIVFTEVDIVPEVDEDNFWYLYDLFTANNYKSRLYLSTRNELEGNLSMLDKKVSQRKEFARTYKGQRMQEIYQHYQIMDEFDQSWIDINIYKLPWFVRGFIWQWLIYPIVGWDTEFLKLQIMSLEDNIQLEKSCMQEFGLKYPLFVLKWWYSYQTIGSKLDELGATDALHCHLHHSKTDLTIIKERKIEDRPLHVSKEVLQKSSEEKISVVEKYLNNIFLIYQTANQDSLKNAMIENERWEYIINFKMNSKDNQLSYHYRLGSMRFERLEKTSKIYDEIYWIDDIIEFLEWYQELYSNFLQYLEPGTSVRLWSCLWANFINNEIVKKKIRYHFELAKSWKTADEYVLNLYSRTT